jgi:hypothetical protein
MTSMASPLGALPAGPATATTEVEENVDCGPTGDAAGGSGSSPPVRLKRTSIVPPPCGALSAGLIATTTEVEEDIDGGSPDGDPGVSTINIKMSMTDHLGGVEVVDPGAPTINAKKHHRRTP